jgi:hypothetical protein
LPAASPPPSKNSLPFWIVPVYFHCLSRVFTSEPEALVERKNTRYSGVECKCHRQSRMGRGETGIQSDCPLKEMLR